MIEQSVIDNLNKKIDNLEKFNGCADAKDEIYSIVYILRDITDLLETLSHKMNSAEASVKKLKPKSIDDCCGNPPGTFAKFVKDNPDPDKGYFDKLYFP